MDFYVPDLALREAIEELPAILESLKALVRTVEIESYAPLESLARQRLARKGP